MEQAAESSAAGGQRRGVFEVDEERALEALRLGWGDAYAVCFDDSIEPRSREGGRGGWQAGAPRWTAEHRTSWLPRSRPTGPARARYDPGGQAGRAWSTAPPRMTRLCACSGSRSRTQRSRSCGPGQPPLHTDIDLTMVPVVDSGVQSCLGLGRTAAKRVP